MPTPDGHRYLPSTAIFLVELLKLVVCLTIALYEISLSAPRTVPATFLLSELGNAVFSGDSWKLAIPASLYTLANSLQYVGISNLDAATFHVLYQFKIFVTAVFAVFLLRRRISGRQWIALILLMVSLAQRYPAALWKFLSFCQRHIPLFSKNVRRILCSKNLMLPLRSNHMPTKRVSP